MAVTIDDLIRRSYGGLYVAAGGGTQNTNATPGVYNKLTQFATAGAASYLVVPSVANNNIQVLKSGIWLCLFSISFDPGHDSEFAFQVWAGTSGAETARTNVTGEVRIKTASDLACVAASGFIVLVTYDVVDLRVANLTEASKSVAVKYANIHLLRVGGA